MPKCRRRKDLFMIQSKKSVKDSGVNVMAWGCMAVPKLVRYI